MEGRGYPSALSPRSAKRPSIPGLQTTHQQRAIGVR